MMRVLVTGADGQLGTDVVLCLKSRGITCIASDVSDMDITDQFAVDTFFNQHKPDAVVHCAAYTAVDKAEQESDLCRQINVEGTRNVAAAAERLGAKMIYISTDYVYSGEGCAPQREDAPLGPCSVYGRTKLAGEQQAHICRKLFIVRTSWVFGLHGGNFVKTMLHLSESRDCLRVVSDQIGSPTFTEDLAVFLFDLLQTERYGIYNASNEGFCSWHTFAESIFRIAGKKVCVEPIRSEDYCCAAMRPKNSRMDKQALRSAGFAPLPHWQDALMRYLHQYI